MADVPLGMFLSGGIDSSAICAMMSEMVSEPIKTFSVGFEDREANEFEYARIVADAYKTDHHEIMIGPEQFFRGTAEADLARRRTARFYCERAALFCFEACAGACKGSFDGRRQ